MIWVYFWLLLGEGALRKWIFPSLSGPLLIVRDPVLLAIYAMALAQGVFPLNRLVRTTIILGVVSALASLCWRRKHGARLMIARIMQPSLGVVK